MLNAQREERDDSPWVFGRGDRLAKALQVAHVATAEMADYLGVSPNTIGNYTSGRTEPKKQTLRVWAMRTGAPLEWLELGIVGPDGLEPPTSSVKTRGLATVHPIRKAS